MQTRALSTLVEISRVGSFAAAAGKLNMTLSAVSMQIKALETDLGVALFDRSFRPPKLTPVGRSVCDRAVGLLSAEDALRAACGPGDRLVGIYRLGFVMTASVRLLPDFLINARRKAPHAAFEIVSGLSEALEEQIIGGGLDGAVVTASPAKRAVLRYDVLRDEPLVYAVPAASFGRTLAELRAELPFLHFTPSTGIGKLIAGIVGVSEPVTQRRIVLDSVETIMGCVKKRLGFTLLPRPDVERYAQGQVEILTLNEQGYSRQLVLATSRKSTTGEQAKRMVELFSR